MRNQYVGDVGDYVKLAILREIGKGRKLGVAWWVCEIAEQNNDGKHRAYLDSGKQEWRTLDGKLWDMLEGIQSQDRCIGLLHRTLPANTHFEVKPIPDEADSQEKWLSRLNHCNLVFLDPDNGIADSRGGGKNVVIADIERLARKGRTLVVYHHCTRKKGGFPAEIKEIFAHLREKGLNPSGAVRVRAGTARAFLFVNADSDLVERVERLTARWPIRGKRGKRIEWIAAV